MKTMTMRVTKDGKIELTVNGVTGPACSEFLRPVIEGFGNQVTSEQETPEMYECVSEAITEEN